MAHRIYAQLAHSLRRHGLLARGGFHPDAGDFQGTEVPGTVLLIGNVGPDLFRSFDYARPMPLDTWVAEQVDPIAGSYGARAVYPSDGPPYYPFQAWAKRADKVFGSPLGILVHPRYGLWHAYRAALLFKEKLSLPAVPDFPSPCVNCADRPCLHNCPVAAFSEKGYDVPTCASHLLAHDSGNCRGAGCLARRACPVGQDYIYSEAQAAFHMRAFLAPRSH